ncbi:hypothetical protein EKO27_g10928 [Xylaria grammica]|uniref:Uncharacterized protein n=1 Tax=Xylaria grammica TaxID=363999 RepID=A0A439CPV7_9PEZI|nr:hypothetical protein EKO27_g10928 [Xylaria grammica]
MISFESGIMNFFSQLKPEKRSIASEAATMPRQRELTESDCEATIANAARNFGLLKTSRHFGGNLPPKARAKAPASKPPGWDETLLYKLPDKVDGLEEEIRSLREAVNKLQQGKHKEAALQSDLKKAEDDLRQTRENNEELNKRLKKAAKQLNEQRSRGVGMGQTSDSDLINSVRQLRYLVQRFSVQYFTDTTPRQPGVASTHNFERYMAEATGCDDYDSYLMSNETEPGVIQSFVWRLLLGEIFEKFRWASGLQDPMIRVYEALRSAYVDGHGQAVPIASDAEQRFQTWKATTSALVLEKIQNKKGFERENRETNGFIRDLSTNVHEFLRPLAKGPREALEDLQSIIEAAITLDQDICCQPAPIYWGFMPSQIKELFNADSMRVEDGEVTPRPGQYVDMVTAPALIKRRWNDLSTEDRLLSMTVTCRP